MSKQYGYVAGPSDAMKQEIGQVVINHALCSGLMKPDTHLGENARQIEVSDDQTTPLLYS